MRFGLRRTSLMRFEGTRPDNLGVDANGRLAPCPSSPNCIHSQKGRGRTAVEPLHFSGGARNAMQRLQQTIASLPRATIITASNDYLYAEFRSRVFGFVDDVEFVCDRRASAIHVRAASRIPYVGLGTNRRRVETIRRKFSG